ncbi:MAG: tRNA (guanosine(37)-N1)-methyltransferase TrmD [Clostridia bacterium]|nr:tRNA (guanosine(37)-N1)-methyltransferase TrmD [Clostridia bacterium]MBQ3554471.1 tRNA (guanosine(37)-N1)-methyltransferase TrmD [Clostridia bacterium]
MRFDCLTLFPDMMRAVLSESIIGRAQTAGILDIRYTNIRDFAENKHNRVDDYPYGGGEGMVMQAMPIYRAWQSVTQGLEKKPKVIYLSPQGKVFDQRTAVRLSKEEHLILLCGHYEGVDERVLEEIVDEEISMGDFVLTGGEIPAMALIDAVGRLIPGVLSSEDAYAHESHFDGLLEHAQYTRPPECLGKSVPEILLSGHHKNIMEYKRKESILRTLKKRPDMLEKAPLTDKERKWLDSIREEM